MGVGISYIRAFWAMHILEDQYSCYSSNNLSEKGERKRWLDPYCMASYKLFNLSMSQLCFIFVYTFNVE